MKKLILITVFVLAGCNPNIYETRVLLGDSVMELAALEIHQEHLWNDNSPMLIFNGISGMHVRDTDYLVPRLMDIQLRADVDVMVVNLGINDITNGETVQEIEANLDTVMAAVDSGIQVYWIEPTFARPEDEAQRLAVVQAIHDATVRWPNLTVVSFRDYVAANGLILEDMRGDGVHLSAQGKRQFAIFIATTI